MDVTPRRIEYYSASDGSIPYRDWHRGLKNPEALIAIDRRFTRIERGLLGDCKGVGGGVYELRIDMGPGYRIYFGQPNRTIVLLLWGGDKSKQRKDIKQARQYLKDHLRRQGK